MDKKHAGLIIFLFGISTLSLELFFINIIQNKVSTLPPISKLLFTVFPMNIGFYIPIILSCVGIFFMVFAKNK